MAFARAASTCERLPATPMAPSIDVAQPQGVGPAQISAGTSFRMIRMGLGKSISTALQLQDGRTLLPLSFMQVFVKTLTGKTPIFHFEASDTIDNVKDSFLSTTHMLLRLRGGIQIYMKTSADSTITADVELLYLLLSLREGMRIFVKTLTNKTITIVEEYGVEIFDRLDKGAHAYLCVLKGMISGQICGLIVLQLINIATAAAYGLGVNDSIQLFAMTLAGAADYQSLIFAGKQLEDGRTISVLGIQKLLSLRVGMQTTAKTWNNITITQNVEASDVIRALSISPLLEGRTLSDYNIHEGNQLCQAKIPNKKGTTSVWQRLMLTSTQYGKESTLHLVLQLCGDMPISVNTLTGKTIPFDAMFYENPCIPVQSP